MGSPLRAACGLLALLVFVLLLVRTEGQNYMKAPKDMPCFTGVARLELVSDDCQDDVGRMAPLSRPFDPATQLPWDCLSSMLVSVDGCKVSMASLVNVSQTLFNFSCNILEYQGIVVDGSMARVSAWVRPQAVARYMLRYSDLDALAAQQGQVGKPKPTDWQEQLAEMFGTRGTVLQGLDNRLVVLQQNSRRCNTTYEVVSGGLLGAGSVNASSIGWLVFPSGRPFAPPWVIRAERPRPWAARARGIFIALVVVVSLLGAALLLALAYLFYRLMTAASKAQQGGVGPLRGSPFEDGGLEAGGQQPGGPARTGSRYAESNHVGVGSLEHNARAHGTSGGL